MRRICAPECTKASRTARHASCYCRTHAPHTAGLDARPQDLQRNGRGEPDRWARRCRRSVRCPRPCPLALSQPGGSDAFRRLHRPRRGGMGAAHAGERARRPHADRRARIPARAGYSAPLLAALAHFVERAVSVYQPAYLLLAHSLEQPRISTLMMGVHECAALAAANPTAFSVEELLPELEPLLMVRPEWFGYCPELEAQTVTSSLVSPYAV